MNEGEEIKELFKKLVDSKIHPFTNKGTPVKVSEKHGVYIIYNSKGKLFYVGRTLSAKGGLNQRLNNHRTGASTFSKSLFKKEGLKIDASFSLKFIEVGTDRKRALLEAYTTGCLCPPYLGTGEKVIK
jgi:excinuclease UvrABC nuclease subunit